MLQKKYLSDFDFNEVHRISINQTPERIFSLVDKIDLRDSPIINFLFRIRGLQSKNRNLKSILDGSFIPLEETNSEIILGLVGQFWKPQGNLQKLDTPGFINFHEDGFLKATWNFKTIPQSNTVTILETETRIKCIGKSAHGRFSIYWFFIKPFSGIIRNEILRLVKKKAEAF